MSRPRLCEILGVDVNEEFTYGSTTCRINEKGVLESMSEYYNWFEDIYGAQVCEMVNYPKFVHRKSKWSYQDIDDAKAVRRVLPEVRTVKRIEHESHEQEVIVDFEHCSWFGINNQCFPSLRCGEEASLDKILDSEVKEC